MRDRGQPTAAATWDEESIDFETFKQLFDVLRAHPDYEVRPAIQVSHDDSAMVKTIETLPNAEETLADLRSMVMFSEEPFSELTDDQLELLADHEFAQDSRSEIREYLRDDSGSRTSDPPGEGTQTREVLEAFEPGEVVTNQDIAGRVSDDVVYGNDAGAVASFVGTLCNRGFVERTNAVGKPQRYRLTERGEEVVDG